MASYDIGELLLKLGYSGEQEFTRSLNDFERKILAADKAGESFYNHNRAGYNELKNLTTTAAATLGQLATAFARNEVSAEEYARALQQAALLQQTAAKGGERLGASLKSVSNDFRQQHDAIRANVTSLKTYEDRLQIIDALHRTGVTNTRTFRRELDELGKEAKDTAERFDRLSDEYVSYINVAGKAGAIKGRVDSAALRESYFSKQFILGNALSNMYGELGIRAFDLAANTIRSFDDMSVAWEEANESAGNLMATSERMGVSFRQVDADVDAVAQKYMLLASDAEGAAAALLEAGYSTGQVRAMLDAVGATALERGQDVREAFAGIASSGGDVEGALSSAVGATEAYDRALISAAAGQRDMVASLSETERQAALVAAVTGTAAGAMQRYGQNTDGIVGAQLAQAEAVAKLRMELGEELAPTVLRTTEMWTRFIGVVTQGVGPVVTAAEAVGQFAGRFGMAEVALVGMVTVGPRALALFSGMTLSLTALKTALAGVFTLMGGWPALIAVVGIGAIQLFKSIETPAEQLAESLAELETGAGAGAAGLQKLSEAADKQGVLGAVDALAETMDGDARDAFTTYAEEAVESAETTVEAIDSIYAFLAERRRETIENTLEDLNKVLGPLLQEQETSSAYAATPDGEAMTALLARQEQLLGEKALLEEQLGRAEGEGQLGILTQLEEVNAKLLTTTTELDRLNQAAPFGAAIASTEQRAEREARIAELKQQQLELQQELNMLDAKPRQAVNSAFGVTDPASGGGGRTDGGGGTEDPLADIRGRVNVARASLNALRAEHERLGSTDSYVKLEGGMQNYLAQLGMLSSEMQKINQAGDLSYNGQVELVNLLAEQAALTAEIAGSSDVERERNATAWVAGLEQRLGQGKLEAVSGMKLLRDAQANLKAEMEKFPDWSVMTPEQQAQFGMFQRLLEYVQGGIDTFQASLDEDAAAAVFQGAIASARELIKEQKLIGPELMNTLSEGGANMDVFEGYNAGIEAGQAKAQELLDIQARLELSGLEMARSQSLNGEAIDAARNRAEALREAITAAYAVDTPEGDALALSLEAQLSVLDGMIAREDGLAAGAAEVAAQVKLAEDTFYDLDVAAERASEGGASNLEVMSGRLSGLRDALHEAEDAHGRNSVAANKLRAAYMALLPEVEKLERFWDSQGSSNADAVLAQLATVQYKTFAEAVKGLGLAADDTGPLMQALREAFNADGVESDAEKYRELAEAMETVKFAMANNVKPPEWALDLLEGNGTPVQTGPDGRESNNAALREANELIADYNAGLATGPGLAADLRAAEESLRSEMDKTNASTRQGKADLLAMAAALQQLQGLMGAQTKLTFMEGAKNSGDISGNEFSKFAAGKIEEHRKAQQKLFAEAKAGNKEAQEAWNGHMAMINLYSAAMEEAVTTSSALAQGFTNLAISLRESGMEGAAGAADILAGVFTGLQTALDGGSITDTIKAIGQAFQQSADVSVKALGKMIDGVGALAAGIATGDYGAIVGGALGLLSGLIDIFTQGAKALAEAEQEVRDYEKGFSVVDPTGAMSARAPTREEQATTYESERAQAAADGILWPWEDYGAWQKAIMPITVDDAQMKASFEAAESGLGSALKSAMKSAAEGGGMGDFRKGFREAVLDGLIDGFLASKAFQKSLGEPLNNYYEVANDPNSTQAEIDAAWDAVETGYARAEEQVLRFGERWADSFGAEALADELRGSFGGAFQAGMDARLDFDVDTSSAEAFKEAFSVSLKEMVKQRLIEAFMESAAMKPLFDQLGAVLSEALKDGVIDAVEQAQIDALTGQITEASETLADSLEGLDGEKRIDVLIDKGSLTDLWAEYDKLTDDSRLVTKEAELREEIRINNTIKDRVKLSITEFKTERAKLLAKGNLTKAEREQVAALDRSIKLGGEYLGRLDDQNAALEEQIANLETLDAESRKRVVKELKVRLGIDVESLRGSLAGAFDASSYEEFVNGFSGSMRDTLRNALVTAFLETAAMSAVLKKLSDAIFNAMRDGEVDATELAGIKELSKEAERLGGELYKVLEAAGLTTPKSGKQEAPDMSKWNALGQLMAGEPGVILFGHPVVTGDDASLALQHELAHKGINPEDVLRAVKRKHRTDVKT